MPRGMQKNTNTLTLSEENWDRVGSKWNIVINYFVKDLAIYGQYYANLLKTFIKKNCEKNTGFSEEKKYYENNVIHNTRSWNYDDNSTRHFIMYSTEVDLFKQLALYFIKFYYWRLFLRKPFQLRFNLLSFTRKIWGRKSTIFRMSFIIATPLYTNVLSITKITKLYYPLFHLIHLIQFDLQDVIFSNDKLKTIMNDCFWWFRIK